MNSKILPILTKLTTALTLISKETEKAIKRGQHDDFQYFTMVLEKINILANDGLRLEPEEESRVVKQ